jgi:hypothetical protein
MYISHRNDAAARFAGEVLGVWSAPQSTLFLPGAFEERIAALEGAGAGSILFRVHAQDWPWSRARVAQAIMCWYAAFFGLTISLFEKYQAFRRRSRLSVPLADPV